MVPHHAMSTAQYWLLSALLGGMTSVVDIVLEELRLHFFKTDTDDIVFGTTNITYWCHREDPDNEEQVSQDQ